MQSQTVSGTRLEKTLEGLGEALAFYRVLLPEHSVRPSARSLHGVSSSLPMRRRTGETNSDFSPAPSDVAPANLPRQESGCRKPKAGSRSARLRHFRRGGFMRTNYVRPVLRNP